MTGDVRPMYVIDEVLVDGRPLVRIREVLPASGKIRTPANAGKLGHLRKRRTGVVVALVVAVLGVLGAAGWAVWFALSLLFAHAVEVGVALALVVLLAAGGGGACTVTVIHRRG